jgi:alanine racemase
MGRLGATGERLPQVISVVSASRHLTLEGVLTHFASSEILDAPSVADQIANFEAARQLLTSQGLEPPLVHVANT